MTPNPNPSPELIDWTQPVEAVHTSGQINAVRVVQQGRGEPHAFALVEFCKQFWGCTEDGTVTAYGWRVRNVAALTPPVSHEQDVSLKAALPAPGEVDYAEMLQTAWESCPSGDGLGLPPIIFSDAEAAHIVKSLATVAAANDEGVADEVTLCLSDRERVKAEWADLADHFGHEAAALPVEDQPEYTDLITKKPLEPWAQEAMERSGPTLATVALDWRAIAKLAGEHGVRYRTNTALEQFLAAIRLLSQGGGKA